MSLKKIIINIVLLSIFFLAILLSILMRNNILKLIYKKEYSEYVSKYSKEYNVNENLIYSIIKAESNFNERATSNKGAKGLMQLMEVTAKDTSKKINLNISSEELDEKLFDKDININLGTKYISVLIEKYGNIEIAITAYNAGIGTVDKWIETGVLSSDGTNIENIPYKETNNYVRKILRNYKIYQKIYLDK